MEHRRIGPLEVSLVGLGCNNFGWRADAAGTAAVVDAALPDWIDFFDTADVYGAGQSEEYLGQASLPYFPLVNGLLTGKYRSKSNFPENSRGKDDFGLKVFTEENLSKAQALEEFAVANGRSLLELAISWLAMRPEIASVIAGAKTPEQVRANAQAAGWKLNGAAMTAVDRIVGG